MTDIEKIQQNTPDILLEDSNCASSDQNTRQLRVTLDDKPGRRNSAPDWYSDTALDGSVSYDPRRRLSHPGAEMDKVQNQYRSLPGQIKSNRDKPAATVESASRIDELAKTTELQRLFEVKNRGTAIQSEVAQDEECISSIRTTLLPRSLNPNCAKGLQGGDDVETRVPQQEQANKAGGVYIPPGNNNEEYYRLATFGKYPSKAKAKCTDIAAAGFYYTGIRDKVTTCFSCGISVENWTAGVDGMDKKWHQSDCGMMTREDTGNKPLPTPNYRTVSRAHNGLPNPYLGNVASVQIQSKKAAADAESLQNIAISTKESSTAHGVSIRPPHEDALHESNYSVLRLVSNPEHELLLRSLDLKKEEDRRKTFSKWPANLAQNSPCDFAKKGFFYLGHHDHIQCFCCSGCLQNWPSTDDKFEHEQLHLPECKMSQELDSGNIPLTDDERRNANKTDFAGTIENGIACDLESESILMTKIQRQVADEADRVGINELRSAKRNEETPIPSIEEQQQLAVDPKCSSPVNSHIESLEDPISSFDSNRPEKVYVTKEDTTSLKLNINQEMIDYSIQRLGEYATLEELNINIPERIGVTPIITEETELKE